MAARPDLGWYKRFPDKALAGMFELNLEQRGAYGTIIDLIYSRAGDLPFDLELLKKHLQVNARVVKRLVDELVALDKIQIVDGVIRTRRSDVEIQSRLSVINAQSEGGKQGAEKRWNSDAQGSFEEVSPKFEESLSKKSAKSGEKLPEFSPKLSPNLPETQTGNGEKPPKTAKVTHSADRLTRARESESEKEKESTPSTESLNSEASKTKNPLDGDDDILNRVNVLAKIAGLNLTRPEKLATALDQLREWLGEGIDFERDILPTIKARSADNPSETVHSLRYFDAAVRKRFGLSSQGIAAPKPLTPPKPKDPIAAVDGPGDRVTEFRSRLTRTIGPRIYNNTFAPEHCAIEIEDNLVRLRFRSDAEATLAEARFGDGVSTAARAMSLAPTMGALKS